MRAIDLSQKEEVFLPPPLMTSEPNSFARHTITTRAPQIIQQVITNNDYPPEIVAELMTLRSEIDAEERPRSLQEEVADTLFWRSEWAKHSSASWLELPWYFAETFFYRRLLEAVRYKQPGPWQGHDPFGKQKTEQIERAVDQLALVWTELTEVEPEDAFAAILHSCLWGNRVDLSNLTVSVDVPHGTAVYDERQNLLIDHTDDIQGLLARTVDRVSFVNDNVGLDILFDLVLADFLLAQGWAQKATFNLKEQPFYVSDAMITDADATLSQLEEGPHGVRELGQRLRQWQDQGQLALCTDPFWTTCLSLVQMPPELAAKLAQSDLIILKGDVNYRRLLSDRYWPFTARLEEIASYFPRPFVTLRTLKSEIMVGLEPGQADRLRAEDPSWLINGQRGAIHLVTRQ